MTHQNAPLTPEGRKRLCERIDSGRPIAHVAAEAGVSRATLSKWYGRWTEDGAEGLMDRTSRPKTAPNAISDDIVDAILELRRLKKWGKARIAAHLNEKGVTVSDATVQRTLQRHQISRVVNMDPPTGESSRKAVRYEHEAAGDMLHVDVKKVGKIPTGGGWRIHGQGSEQHKASKRKGQGTGRVGLDYLHSAVDDYSRIAYTEVLEDEKGPTAAAFWLRAVEFFAEHGFVHIERCLTDNGSCYRSHAWREALEATGTRHKRTRPYTPKTNGKVERYNQTMAAEWLYVRAYTSNAERTAALVDFLNEYNYERNHSSIGWRPPMSRAPASSGALLESVPIDLEAPEITDEQLTIFDL